jgi:hypothetical protein
MLTDVELSKVSIDSQTNFNDQENHTVVDKTRSTYQCRICLESTGVLRCVCNCVQSRVHVSCLNKWRHQKALNAYAIPIINNFAGINTCEVCMTLYKHVDCNFSLTAKARRKFIILILRDLFIIAGFLGVCYYVFGWNAPVLWRKENKHPENWEHFFNGVIWTHAIITIVYLLLSMCCGMRSIGHGTCCCCFCPGDVNVGSGCDRCDKNGGEVFMIVALVTCILFAIVGIFITTGFILDDVIYKHKLQMQAESFFEPRFELELDQNV